MRLSESDEGGGIAKTFNVQLLLSDIINLVGDSVEGTSPITMCASRRHYSMYSFTRVAVTLGYVVVPKLPHRYH
jgi:hypothetical protein